MKPSSGLRVYFAIECLFWLGWLTLDLLTVSTQFKIAQMIPVRGMPFWFAASVVVNLAMVVSSAIGVRRGAGAFSGSLGDGPRGWVVAVGIVLRLIVGLAMGIWLTVMSGAQSV